MNTSSINVINPQESRNSLTFDSIVHSEYIHWAKYSRTDSNNTLFIPDDDTINFLNTFANSMKNVSIQQSWYELSTYLDKISFDYNNPLNDPLYIKTKRLRGYPGYDAGFVQYHWKDTHFNTKSTFIQNSRKLSSINIDSYGDFSRIPLLNNNSIIGISFNDKKVGILKPSDETKNLIQLNKLNISSTSMLNNPSTYLG